MKQKFQNFMSGRYGVDDFSKALLYATLALCLVSLFTRNRILNLLLTAGLVFIYYRMFSKNYSRRYQENLWYLRQKDKVMHFFQRQNSLAQQRKTHRIYTCPQCRQKIRIPKGHGKVQITCPQCKTAFIKRS
jgi:predicted membrane protein